MGARLNITIFTIIFLTVFFSGIAYFVQKAGHFIKLQNERDEHEDCG
jgi:hypothetical protein